MCRIIGGATHYNITVGSDRGYTYSVVPYVVPYRYRTSKGIGGVILVLVT